MNRNGPRGLLFSAAGAFVVALGVTLLTQPCGLVSLAPTGVVCTMPTGLAEAAYFLASVGGALVAVGVWQTGIWRKRIRAEGARLVIAVGTAVSTLGFLASNLLPQVSTNSAEIGFFLGIVGGALLTGGVVKISVGQNRLSLENSSGAVLKKPGWSRRDWTAFALLTGVLVATTAISASIYYPPIPTCTACPSGGLVTPCPGREALDLESYTLNSPTNATLDIRNTGTASVTLVDYYVKDSTGDLYSSTNWAGPAAAPNALMQANIIIDGNAVIFQTGNTYTITVVTSRNQGFTFTMVA